MFLNLAVNARGAGLATYTYSVPAGEPPPVGSLVLVPFGARPAQAVVLEHLESTDVRNVRPILGILDETPLLTPAQVALAIWLSDYYLAPKFLCCALMLPPGLDQEPQALLSVSPTPGTGKLPDGLGAAVLARLAEGDCSPAELEADLGPRAPGVAQRLVSTGWLTRTWRLPLPTVHSRTLLHARPVDGAQANVADLRQAPAQLRALEYLLAAPEPVPLTNLRDQLGVSSTTVRALEQRGLVVVEDLPVRRVPRLPSGIGYEVPQVLTRDQEAAVATIDAALGTANPKPILLDGVAGSGKTEVYLRAAEAVLQQGRGVIVLVPEIALAPQTVARFMDRFGDRLALLHSGLSAGEQYDEWHRIRNGEASVVVGARGALFAPVQRPGLIVIDEAHEWSYKQADAAPRYDARAAAIQLGQLTGAVVLEGTATPSLEAYYRARRGVYRHVTMTTRPTGTPLPKVQIVDMREELRSGNLTMFSRSLQDDLRKAVQAGKQAILYLNRRGTSTHVQCRSCGYVVVCGACDVAMTYHSSMSSLLCHQCGRRRANPETCPECGSNLIRYLGVGTQKVVAELERFFPELRVLRWDRDTARSNADHTELLERFVAGDADVLVGTQMIAKGLDMPGVGLVGVVSADVGLNVPDFRAAERTYQTLLQVIGRAGRRGEAGTAIVQTYQPESAVLQSLANGNYRAFADRELAFRQEHNNPPYVRLARLVFTHADINVVGRETDKLRVALRRIVDGSKVGRVSYVGPASCFFGKVRSKYRWQIVLRGQHLQRVVTELPLGPGWSVDIDPANLL